MTRNPELPPAVVRAASKWIVRRDAGLTPEEARAFEEWAREPLHARALSELDAAWRAMEGPLRAGLGDTVVQRVRAVTRRRRQVRCAAAAGVLLAGGLAWGGYHRAQAAAEARTVVLLPERRVLPDGSVAELKEGAELAIDYTPRLRRVILRRGEAFFQVAKNPARPFLVEAGGVAVRDVGTQFSVESVPGEVDVLVAEGRVAVGRAGAGGALSTLATLGAEDRAAISLQGGAPPQISHASPEELRQRLAWRRERLQFSGTPLSAAIRLINARGGVRFVLSDRALGRVRISGTVYPDDAAAFSYFLRAGFRIQTEALASGQLLLRPEGAPAPSEELP